MSQETSQWLNTHTLIGFTAKRGNAWHYRADLQAGSGNHFEGAVPMDAARKLLGWVPLEGTVESTIITDSGVTRLVDSTRKTIVHPTTGEVFAVPKVSFQVHGFEAWLLDGAQQIADASANVDGAEGLQLASVGELKGGAIAWAQYELPETVSTPEGFDFRPFFTSATSLNGTLSSTFLTGMQAVVCDNTLSGALGDKSHMVKIRHSVNSLGRIGEIRKALGLFVGQADAFSDAIAELCATEVTDRQWAAFLDAHDATTLIDAKGEPKTGRGLTNAERVRDEMNQLQRHDLRCSQWTGTAFGVVQTVNTWAHHLQGVRGEDASKGERNMLRVVRSQVDALDLGTLTTLRKVLATV